MSRRRLTASNLVSYIDKLPKDVAYNYASRAKTQVMIVRLEGREGPIVFKRFGTKKTPLEENAVEEKMSSEMIWRIANALKPSVPVNFDRLLGASYNARSAFEALLLHTPEFYTCKPGRLEHLGGEVSIKAGHKHVLWIPDDPHKQGLIVSRSTDLVVSEVSHDTVLESVEVSHVEVQRDTAKAASTDRVHAHMQISLYEIGKQLGYRTWVATNDQNIVYKDKPIVNFDEVISDLSREKLLQAFSEAAKSGKLIDIIWFKNGRLMPAVIEIENSTGVLSGLTRMQNFQRDMPNLGDVYWIIVAPDSDREKVLKSIKRSQFASLNARYLPYSAVEELYSLSQRRGFKGVCSKFLENFFEDYEFS